MMKDTEYLQEIDNGDGTFTIQHIRVRHEVWGPWNEHDGVKLPREVGDILDNVGPHFVRVKYQGYSRQHLTGVQDDWTWRDGKSVSPEDYYIVAYRIRLK